MMIGSKKECAGLPFVKDLLVTGKEVVSQMARGNNEKSASEEVSFQVKITQKNKESEEKMTGKINNGVTS